jgi:hypothetical protein
MPRTAAHLVEQLTNDPKFGGLKPAAIRKGYKCQKKFCPDKWVASLVSKMAS